MAAPQKKKADIIVKLQIAAGGANPAPPVGTALGPTGVNMMKFCQAFNEQTKHMEKGLPIPVVITIKQDRDRTFNFVLKTPPAPELLKRAINIKKGSGEPHINKVGKISLDQLKEIAELKMVDLSANTMDAAIKIITGTARSMGIEVEGV